MCACPEPSPGSGATVGGSRRESTALAVRPGAESGGAAHGALIRAVFLDRDGVINRALVREGKPYPPRQLSELEILPGVLEACRRLKEAGYQLVVATNQPDVGRGTLAQEAVEELHAHLCRQLPIDRVEVCYHPGRGDSACDCRKPQPGMLWRAARELHLDLGGSFMVGDRWRDIDCGWAAGCTTIWIDYGYAEALRRPPHHRAKNLGEAADIILGGGEHPVNNGLPVAGNPLS